MSSSLTYRALLALPADIRALLPRGSDSSSLDDLIGEVWIELASLPAGAQLDPRGIVRRAKNRLMRNAKSIGDYDDSVIADPQSVSIHDDHLTVAVSIGGARKRGTSRAIAADCGLSLRGAQARAKKQRERYQQCGDLFEGIL